MSYIRCLSNPEGLYIWGTDKEACIACDKFKQFKTIPIKTFEGLLKKYNKSYDDCISYSGAKIEKVFIPSKKQSKFAKMLKTKDGKYQMRLSYKDWHIDMWSVTWDYIAQH